jgi:ribosomal protein S27AE
VSNQPLVDALFRAEFRRKMIRGCRHEETKANFCGVCGESTWVMADADDDFSRVQNGKCLVFYGDGNSPQFAGIPAEKTLEKMTIPESKEFFIKLCREKLKVDVPKGLVSFMFGEVVSG